MRIATSPRKTSVCYRNMYKNESSYLSSWESRTLEATKRKIIPRERGKGDGLGTRGDDTWKQTSRDWG